MKIGILSMQEIANYGSFLQAYGLKKTIEDLGHTVEFVNIIPGEQLPQYRRNKFHLLKLAFNRIKYGNPIQQIIFALRFRNRFTNEFFKELCLLEANNSKHYDCIVIGSDEVFNIAQSTWFGFSKQLFGENLNSDKAITYAACCGATTVAKLDELGIRECVANMLSKNFSAISIRDDNSQSLVTELTGKVPFKNIDPVLLYSFSEEIFKEKVHSEEKYMIVYTYPNRIRAKDEVKAIKDFAKKRGLKIISTNTYIDWVDEVVVPHPFEVLAYFRDAEYIITDTFHGTVMSIKYNRPFTTIVRDMNSNKLRGLLTQFELDDRIASDSSHIESILSSPINYSPVNALIKEEQERSIDYLKTNL